MATEDSTILQSSEKVFDILDHLVQVEMAGVTELATETSYHKSTVYVHLQTLQELGLVVKSGKKYRPSFKFVEYGEKIKRGTDIYTEGREAIETIAQETGELAVLGVPEDGDVVIVHAASGAKATQELAPGTRMPMESSAVGRVILAHRETAVEETTEEGDLVQVSETRLGDDDLAAVRHDGYAVNDGETSAGTPHAAAPVEGESRAKSHRVDVDVRSIAAPVVHEGEPVGAVGVTGPAKRITGEYQTDSRKRVVNAANLIETKLKYQ